MSDHTHALVPIEAWSFSSPDLRVQSKNVDVGLLAESLIYYESVAFNVGNPHQFAEFLSWFVSHGNYADFLSLVRDGTISIYDYAFITAPIFKDGVYSIWNIQDQIQVQPDTFERRVLYHKAVENVLPKSRHRKALYEAIRNHVCEVKSEHFKAAIENARIDFRDPRRQEVIVQALVDSIFEFKGL